jgi:hypothetical protein
MNSSPTPDVVNDLPDYPGALYPPADPREVQVKLQREFPSVSTLSPIEPDPELAAISGVNVDQNARLEGVHNPDGLDLYAPAWKGLPYINVQGIPVVETFEHMLPDPKCRCGCTENLEDQALEERLTLINNLVEADTLIDGQAKWLAVSMLKYKQPKCELTWAFTLAWIACLGLSVLLVIVAFVLELVFILEYVVPVTFGFGLIGSFFTCWSFCDIHWCRCSHKGFVLVEEMLKENRFAPGMAPERR